MPESVRKTVSLPLGFVRCGMYGALMNESENRFDPLTGCCSGVPVKSNGCALK